MSGHHYTAAEVAQQTATIMDLHLGGMTLSQISKQTGIPESTIDRRIHAVVESFAPKVEEYRRTVTMRLERVLKALDAGLQSGDPTTVALSAGKILAAVDQLRRLYGMDAAQAPQRVEIYDPTDLAIRDLVLAAEEAGRAVANATPLGSE